MKIMHILDTRHVKRFHTLRMIGEQTIADHSWGVACIALHLALSSGKDSEFIIECLVLALAHDTPERKFGDMPGDVKAELSTSTLEEFGKLEDVQQEFLWGSIPVEDDVRLLVRTADLLDLIHTCAAQRRMGNTSLNKCFDKAVELVQTIIDETKDDAACVLFNDIVRYSVSGVIE